MLDVHPPDHAPHTLRDFTLHIATIVVGLLIAIGLEQTVEWAHHRHQRHAAEHNLQLEIEANRKTLAKDVVQLNATVVHMREGIVALDGLRKHIAPTTKLSMQWEWDDMAAGAWDTARETQATSLMSYDEVQHYTDIYGQQAAVNAQATIYIRSVYRSGAPVLLGKQLDQLTPADIDKMESAVEGSAAEVGNLLDLCRGLQQLYNGKP